MDELARTPYTVVISCELDLNMDFLVETIWKNLALLRVYTKKRGEYPDFEGGLIIRAGSSIEHVVSGNNNMKGRGCEFRDVDAR